MAKRWILGAAAAFFAASAGAATVRDVRVAPIGDVPVSAEQVLAQIGAKVGRELDRAALSEDVRALQRSGAYSYAETRLEPQADGGVILWIRVAGRPKIRNLSVSGAEYLGNKKIRTLLEIGSGDRADAAVLGEKAQKVRDHYRKDFFPEAKLAWNFRPVADDPAFADVDIQVEEGRRAVVRRITFKGNRHVRAKDLRKVMAQKQSSWLSWMNNDGVYEPGNLLADREAIRKAFMDQGYLGAEVGEPTYAYVGRKKIDVAFDVVEGPLYTLADWRIEGMSAFPTNEAARGVVAASGQTAGLEAIRRGAQNVGDFYGSRGYIHTDVEPVVSLDTNAATAKVAYRVAEGTLAYIQNVEIRGNSQTKDKVIRREIGVAPGEVYNEVRVRSSENRVRNLNYFSYVGTYPESTAVSNRYNVVFDVEEQRTGQFMVGAGFSSVDNVLGFVELTQGNFDLFGWPHLTGGGQKLKLRATVGESRTDMEMSLIEPWFLNRRLSLGLDLFRHDVKNLSSDYDQVDTGGTLTLGKPFFAFNRVNWIYGLENIEIRDVDDDASDWIHREAGQTWETGVEEWVENEDGERVLATTNAWVQTGDGARLKSHGTMELIRDTRNSTFVATRGFRGSASATLAGGPFGGETDTYQFNLRLAQYVPLWFDHVLCLRGWTSMVEEYGDSDWVPIFDRLFLGGPRNVRAFKYRKVGPKNDDKEPLGGRSAATATAEYTIPLVERVRLAFFYDAGIVWEDLYEKGSVYPEGEEEDVIVGDGELYDGYGLGIRFDFPQFPIQLDYAWPVNTDDLLGDGGRFSFSIGYTY
ncbi:MAG: outer membrane protein assembly factor BamA [Kiritimatiellia bacterium]